MATRTSISDRHRTIEAYGALGIESLPDDKPLSGLRRWFTIMALDGGSQYNRDTLVSWLSDHDHEALAQSAAKSTRDSENAKAWIAWLLGVPDTDPVSLAKILVSFESELGDEMNDPFDA